MLSDNQFHSGVAKGPLLQTAMLPKFKNGEREIGGGELRGSSSGRSPRSTMCSIPCKRLCGWLAASHPPSLGIGGWYPLVTEFVPLLVLKVSIRGLALENTRHNQMSDHRHQSIGLSFYFWYN